MRRNYKPEGRRHRRENWQRRESRWQESERYTSDFANSNTSASSSPGSSQSSSVPELPGFYYDPEKNRYFRLLPGHNNCNPLTKEEIEKKEMEKKRLQHLEEDAKRKKSSRPGLNASLLLRKQQLGLLPSSTYCRRFHELKVSCMQRKEVSIINPEPVGAGTHKYEFILADSSCERLFVVNDVENGFCKYGLLNLNGLWRDVPTAESHDHPYFTNQKVVTACWASLNAPDSHVLVCLLGKPEAPGCVSLMPAWYFRNLAADYDDVRPEVVYNIRISNAWSCAWCLNPRLESSFAAGLRSQLLVLNTITNVQHTFKTDSDVLAQQFATQSLLLYNGCRSGEVFSVDLRVPYKSPKNWKKGVSFSQGSSIASLRLLKDENYLVVSDMSGQIKLWDLRMVKYVQNYEGHVNSYAHLPVHVKEEEGLLLTVGEDCYTRIWSLQDAQLLRTIPSPRQASRDSIPSVAFSSHPGGRRPVPGLLMAVDKDLFHFTYDSSDT